MAFSTAGGGPSRPEMNVTPLIDILLVLIIVFMVIVATSKEYVVNTQLPEESKGEQPHQNERTIVIQIIWSPQQKAPLLKITQGSSGPLTKFFQKVAKAAGAGSDARSGARGLCASQSATAADATISKANKTINANFHFPSALAPSTISSCWAECETACNLAALASRRWNESTYVPFGISTWIGSSAPSEA